MSLPRTSMLLACVAAIVASSLLAAPAQAQSVGPDLEAALHVKLLTFDRGLARSKQERIVIGVVHKPGSSRSTAAAAASFRAFKVLAEKKNITIHRKPVSVVSIPYAENFSAALKKHHVSVIFLAPGLSNEVPKIASAAKQLKLPTLCGVRNYVTRGIAVAVVAKAGKPRILLHIGNAKSSGMSIDPKLMRIAEIIK